MIAFDWLKIMHNPSESYCHSNVLKNLGPSSGMQLRHAAASFSKLHCSAIHLGHVC